MTGVMNYTNPGAVSHNEILEMYKEYIDPEFTWSNFSVEEQAKVIVAARSNNLLDTARVRPFTLTIDSSTSSSELQAIFGPSADQKVNVKRFVSFNPSRCVYFCLRVLFEF